MQKLSGTVLIALAAVLWSSGGALIKLIDADPVIIASLRAGFAGLVLLPFVRPAQLKINWLFGLLVLSYAWLSTSFVIATKWTAAANAIALQSTAPLWIFLTTLVLYRKVIWKDAIAVALIVMGIASFMMEPVVGTSFIGNLVAISCGVAFALTTTLLRKIGITGIGSLSILNLAAAPLIWLVAPEGAGISHINSTGWMALAFLGTFQIGIPYMLYTMGLRTTTVQKATMIALLEPLLNPVWVFIFASEAPTVYGMVGMALILTGLATESLLSRQEKGADSSAGESL